MSEGVPFGPYLIIKRLAQGGMAEVFLARAAGEQQAPRILVLKRMLPVFASDPEVSRMFLDEARIAAQLAHPFMIQVFDVGRVEKTLYIAMDYVHGVTVSELITAAKSRAAPMPWTLAARIGCYICEALQYAHDLKSISGEPLHLVHRDITPQNIMITYTGAPKLVDFGIARAAQRLTVTQPGILKGKLLYAAPEQYREKEVDARTDIYGLGLCLYEMLVGDNPFAKSKNPGEAAHYVLNESPIPLIALRRDVPKKFSEVVQQAMAKDQKDRPQSALEFRTKLELAMMDAKVVIGMPEMSEWLASLFPGRAAFAPQRNEEGQDPEADTQDTSFRPGDPAKPKPGSTQPLDDKKREAILVAMGEAPPPLPSAPQMLDPNQPTNPTAIDPLGSPPRPAPRPSGARKAVQDDWRPPDATWPGQGLGSDPGPTSNAKPTSQDVPVAPPPPKRPSSAVRPAPARISGISGPITGTERRRAAGGSLVVWFAVGAAIVLALAAAAWGVMQFLG